MRATPTAARIALIAIATLAVGQGHAQDWNPFKEKDERARREREARQPAGPSAPTRTDSLSRPQTESNFTPGEVIRGNLPPLSAGAMPVEHDASRPLRPGERSGLPAQLWQGMDMPAIAEHVARLDPPQRSPALLALWKRMWLAPGPGGGQANGTFETLRVETLLRYGLIAGLREHLGQSRGGQNSAAIAMEARARIGLGDRERGCAKVRAIVRQISELPKLAKADALLISGYCAVIEKNIPAASVAAALVHDQNAGASTALAVLDALVAGSKGEVHVPGPMSLLDYRFLEVAGSADPARLIERADGPLLALLASDDKLDPSMRVQAMAATQQPNAFDPDLLGQVYRAASFEAGQLASPQSAGVAPHLKRALLFKAAEAERRPAEKALLMRALLAEARGDGRLLPTAAAMEPLTANLRPNGEPASVAETMLEVLLAAGRYDGVRVWAGQRGSESLSHWLVLADMAEPGRSGPRSAHLAAIEQLAQQGKLPSDLLHRLATVLDALDVQVPIPLWEAASRTPQPDGGHLPETGVLSQLQDAAKKKEVGRTILLAMRTIGPNGAEGAHMIALGDAIRALKRAGLERDARRLGFEALFAAWPRLSGTDL